MLARITMQADLLGNKSLDEYGKNVIRDLIGLVRKYSQLAADKLKTQHMSGKDR